MTNFSHDALNLFLQTANRADMLGLRGVNFKIFLDMQKKV